MKINSQWTLAGVSLFLGLSVFPALAMAETEASKPQLPIAQSSGKEGESSAPVLPSPGESSAPVLPSPGESSAPVLPSPGESSAPVLPSPGESSAPVLPSPVGSSAPVLPSPGSDVSLAQANQEYADQSQVERERSAQQADEQVRIQEEQKKAEAAEQARRRQSEASEQARRRRSEAAEQARIQAEQRRQSEATRQQNGQPEVRVASSSEPSTASTQSTEVEPLSKKVQVEQVAFLCETENGVPMTIAKDKDNKNILIISWEYTGFNDAGYTPQERCKQVSSRFELYRKNNNFAYLTVGTINGQSSICLTSKENGNCGDGIQSQQGLLFTLRPTSNSQEILEKLAIALQSKTTSTQQILEE
jgi:hypothetical protein